METNKAYIYKIRNIINDDYYLGRTIHLEKRKYYHFHFLSKNYHVNRILQNAYNKYGKENFVFEIFKETNKANMVYDEQYFLVFYKGKYNISDSAYTPPSRSMKGVLNPRYGASISDEQKKKTSEFHKGKKWAQGRVVSPEAKRKSSLSHKLLDTPERRQMMSMVQIGLQAGGKNPRAKKVINSHTGRVYDCAKDVLADYDQCYMSLLLKLNKKRKNNTPYKYL